LIFTFGLFNLLKINFPFLPLFYIGASAFGKGRDVFQNTWCRADDPPSKNPSRTTGQQEIRPESRGPFRLHPVSIRYGQRNQAKTVELLLDRSPWRPSRKWIPDNKTVLIKIAYGEAYLAKVAKEPGGKRNWEKRLWELPHGQVVVSCLENRMA
jgi:hypothetical protein